MGECMFRFVAEEEGRALLGERDDFIAHLGAFERAVRMGRNGTAREGEFLDFVKGCVREWSSESRTHVGTALEEVTRKLSRFSRLLPPNIAMVRTTGQEEAGSGYTRGTAIVLPPAKIQYPLSRLERFLIHECFHILTRSNPHLRDRLYGLLDFHPCGEILLPESFDRWRITNPDTPSNEHAISIQAKNRELYLLPILHWAQPMYLPGPYFEHVCMSLLEVQTGPDGWVVAPGMVVCRKEMLTGHFEQQGMTFDQPEEMLAEVFVQLVLDEKNPRHSLTRDLERVLVGSVD